MKATRRALLLLVSLCAPCAAYSLQPTTVAVQARQQARTDGRIRYEYRVINRGGKPITSFAIGSDYYLGTSELVVAPRGWTFDTGLDKGSATSPRAWHAEVITTEESPYIGVEWRNDGSADIQPGQTIEGFSIYTPKPDPRYLHGHWTIIFSDSTVESATLTDVP